VAAIGLGDDADPVMRGGVFGQDPWRGIRRSVVDDQPQGGLHALRHDAVEGAAHVVLLVPARGHEEIAGIGGSDHFSVFQ
jgi:DNA-binding LacI/PurR family transcriptional regulator